jgi:hypothetical protein
MSDRGAEMARTASFCFGFSFGRGRMSDSGAEMARTASFSFGFSFGSKQERQMSV